MKKKYLTSLVILIFLLGEQAISQVTNNAVNELNSSKKLTLEQQLEGTYLVVANDNKVVEAFTTDLLQIIESKREDSRDVTYQASKNTSIIIYSREKINSQEFTNKKK